MSGEHVVSSAKPVKLLYVAGSAGLLWLVARTAGPKAAQWSLLKKVNQNFNRLHTEASEEANRNWDALQQVLGAHLGRPIELSDLTEFERMGASYRWYYVANATRGAWLQLMALRLTPLLRTRGCDAYNDRLLQHYAEVYGKLSQARERLLQFGVPEFFLDIEFRATLAPAI